MRSTRNSSSSSSPPGSATRPARPRAVEARDGERRRQGGEVTREEDRRDGDLADRGGWGNSDRRSASGSARTYGRSAIAAAGLAALPEGAGGTHDVALEGVVRGGVDPRELAVQLRGGAQDPREFSLDFASHVIHVGGQLEARAGREELEHGTERHGAAAEALRFGQLGQDALEERGGAREQRERAAQQHPLAQAIRRAPLLLPHDEHGEVAPSQQRCRDQRPEAAPEHDDVVVAGRHAEPPRRTRPGAAFGGRPESVTGSGAEPERSGDILAGLPWGVAEGQSPRGSPRKP
jgi:hypothetical protein